MIATIPMNRVGAHFDPSPVELPELPQTARGRGQLWSDTVFQAVLALKKQLTHRDIAIAVAAANSILELERTRMRHGTFVAGSEEVSEAQLEYEAEQSGKFDRMDARPAAKPTGEVGARTDEQALAEHIAEVTEAAERSGKQLPGSPAGYVVWQLKKWGIGANAIPKDGFTDYLRGRGTGLEPAQSAA